MKHHREWHDMSGIFRHIPLVERRDWSMAKISETRSRYELPSGDLVLEAIPW
jgi:hypothetical protein